MLLTDPTFKERFYDGAIKSRIQLIWMQDLSMKMTLWGALLVNLCSVTLFFVAYLTVEDRTLLMPNTNSPIVIVSVIFPFAIMYFAAVYAMGLLIYRQRVRWAVRRRATIIPEYDLSLSPLEAAALIGHIDYKTEAWHLAYRFVQTGNVMLFVDADGVMKIKKVATKESIARLRWYEHRVLDDIFISKEQYEYRLRKSMSPERLASLTGLRYDSDMTLKMLLGHMSYAYLSNLNHSIRTRLMAEGFYRKLGVAGVWMQTLLYVMMLTVPLFSFLFAYIIIDIIPWQEASLQFSLSTTVMLIAGYVLGIVICMGWFLSTNIYTRFGLGKYVEAEGLRLYIDVALKDRLRSGNLSSGEMAYFMPYAQMMGLVEGDDAREERILLSLGGM